MYIEHVPNRNSPPAVLLRESYREGNTVKSKRSTNDAAQSKVVERVMSDSEVGQRRSAGIFQGSSAS